MECYYTYQLLLPTKYEERPNSLPRHLMCNFSNNLSDECVTVNIRNYQPVPKWLIGNFIKEMGRKINYQTTCWSNKEDKCTRMTFWKEFVWCFFPQYPQSTNFPYVLANFFMLEVSIDKILISSLIGPNIMF